MHQEKTQKTQNMKKEEEKEQEKIIAEVCGKVINVTSKSGNTIKFTLWAENAQRKFSCSYTGFLPIRSGDALTGKAEYTVVRKHEYLNFITCPFVLIGTDKSSIMELFGSALRGTGYSAVKGENIYKILELEVERTELKDVKSIADLLNKFAMHCTNANGEILDYNPFTLFSGNLNEKQFIKLCQYWYKHQILRNLYLLGLNNKEINNSKLSPLKLFDQCIDNPYAVLSLSLEKCDHILSVCQKPVNMQHRECGKILRKIYDLMQNNGYTAIPSRMLMKQFPQLMEYLPLLKDVFKIETEMFTVYLQYAYEVEITTAEWIQELLDSPPINVINDTDIITTRNDLSEDQKAAVKMALTNNISVITGGAGSGKTATIKELVANLQQNGIKYKLASFTGKAVNRIREVVGDDSASTLHMMIALTKSKNSKGKGKSKENFTHLILDEASMITCELLYEFKKVYSHDFRITFVGDINQLPPIGWGNILEPLIHSNKVPVAVLRKIHRTEDREDNGILINANKIITYNSLDNEFEDFGDPDCDSGFNFTITNNFKIIPGDIEMCKNLIQIFRNNQMNRDEIVVITPYNKDLEILNAYCSELYNGTNRSVVDTRKRVWRIGDRVSMVENDYTSNLMNGTEGTIIDVDDEFIKVSFSTLGENSKVVEFKIPAKQESESFETKDFKTKNVSEEEGDQELTTDSLILSYAVTVHRYQGSEINTVIAYVPEGKPSSSFLNKNLLYTLITRAKSSIWLVGDIPTMQRSAITKTPWRCENLTARLKKIGEDTEENTENNI